MIIHIRGGSWEDYADYVNKMGCNKLAPTYRSDILGFRIVRSFE